MIVEGSAVKVKPFVMTWSPGVTPTAMSASMMADEHEFTPSAYFWFTCEWVLGEGCVFFVVVVVCVSVVFVV